MRAARCPARGDIRVEVANPRPGRGQVQVDVDRCGIGGTGLHEDLEAATPGRVLTPEDVAGCVSYLAGPVVAHLTGQSVKIDGGIGMS